MASIIGFLANVIRSHNRGKTLLGADFSVFLRWFVIVGCLLRPVIIHSEYTTARSIAIWYAISLLYVIASVSITIIHRSKFLIQDENWITYEVLTDTTLITVFYLLTNLPNSDIFLFYFLPLAVAGEYFHPKKATLFFVIISLSFTFSLAVLCLSAPLGLDSLLMFIRYFTPRWSFFFLISYLIIVRGGIFEKLSEELEAFRITAIKISRNEALQPRLKAIIDAATEILNAQGSSIYLKLPNSDSIKVIAVKGVESDIYKENYILRPNEGLAGQVIRGKGPIIENHYQDSTHKVDELGNLFGAVIEYPMFFGDELIGVLAVFDNSGRKFTEADYPALERLAQYAAVAIHDVLILEQIQKQAETLKILNAAGESLMASLNINNTISSIANHAWKIAIQYNDQPPAYSCVGLIDSKTGQMIIEAAYPTSKLNELANAAHSNHPVSNFERIINKAITTETSQFVEDIKDDSGHVKYAAETGMEIAVPIKGKNKVIGIINIRHSSPRAYPEDLVHFIELLASQAGIAIENGILFQEIELQRQRAERLRKASVALSMKIEPKEVAFSILEELKTIVPYTRATLQRIDRDTREIVAAMNLQENDFDPWLLRPISEDKLVNRLLDLKEVTILNDPKTDPLWDDITATKDIKSWIGIPLVTASGVIGVITVDQTDATIYNEDHKTQLDLFANNAANIYYNSILFEQNAKRIEELTHIKEHLEFMLRYLDASRDLALIGLMYGESIHFAHNKLGMAKTKADNIVRGRYDNPVELKSAAMTIISHIDNYLQVLGDTRKRVLQIEANIVDIHLLLDRITTSKRIESFITVKKIYSASSTVIFAPEQQISQVFYVLIQNAIDAMHNIERKHVLTIKTNVVKEHESSFVEVIIADTGTGIAKDERDNVFKLSLPRKGNSKKVRLGLAWARSFMRSFGGDIFYETHIGNGTEMHVLIPIDFRHPRI
jgi:GAF domain-containing protein